MGGGVGRLRRCDLGYDSRVCFLLPASPVNMMEPTEEPSARTPGGPLPAPTTAFSPADTSERGKDSSETSPPASPHSLTTTAPLTSWESDSTAVTGAPGKGTMATLPADPAAPPATSRSPALSSTAASPPLTSNATTQDNALLPLTSNSTIQDKASPPLTSNPTTQDNTSGLTVMP
ncbi:mucin-7-like [Oryx dammah]|uniref:mucin-7-like n=1 Tax=Oryx dammah TaxID=59534 RepID=UPI001A9AF704|nr:mucin-7-like [Oryx dammah]